MTISGKTGEQEEDDNDEQDSLEWRIEPVDPAVEAIEAAKPKMNEFVSTIEVPIPTAIFHGYGSSKLDRFSNNFLCLFSCLAFLY